MIRPPGPLPRMVLTSRPRSATSRRTIGDVSAASAPRRLGRRGEAGRHRLGLGRRRRAAGAGAYDTAGAGASGGAAGAGAPVPARARGSGSGAGAGSRLGLRVRAAGAGGAARGRPGAAGGGGGGVAEHREARADLDRLALGHQDLRDHAGDRRGHLGVDLVGGDLEQGLVGVDVLADVLQPAGDRAFGDRLPELGHRHVHCVLLGWGRVVGVGRVISATAGR